VRPPPPQAVAGDVATSRLSAWLNQNSKVQCEVVTVPEEACTAAALRSLEGKIRAETFVVVSGDLISEMPLKPIVAAHQLSRSLCTVLLSQRRSSPSAETKPGKAPKAVDYIGLDARKQRLLFHASSPDTVRDLKVGMGVVRKFGSVSISSDLADVHFYVFSRAVFPILAAKPQLTNLKLDVLPYLAAQQLRLAAAADAAGTESDADAADSSRQQLEPPFPGLSYLSLGGGSSSGRGPGSGSSSRCVRRRHPAARLRPRSPAHAPPPLSAAPAQPSRPPSASSVAPCSGPGGVGVYIVSDKYCARMNSIQSYGDINRDVRLPSGRHACLSPAPAGGAVLPRSPCAEAPPPLLLLPRRWPPATWRTSCWACRSPSTTTWWARPRRWAGGLCTGWLAHWRTGCALMPWLPGVSAQLVPAADVQVGAVPCQPAAAPTSAPRPATRRRWATSRRSATPASSASTAQSATSAQSSAL
jgi:hypothetical protein